MMSYNNKFYICEHCGNLVGMIHDSGVPMMCCGQKMKKLETVGRVTYTQVLLNNQIASNCKVFCVPKNRRSLEYNRI